MTTQLAALVVQPLPPSAAAVQAGALRAREAKSLFWLPA